MQMVAQGHGIELSKKTAQDAVAVIRSLAAHPDVPPALKKMKDAGFRLYSLTNSPPPVIETQLTQNRQLSAAQKHNSFSWMTKE